jgi:hypothetical protein
MSDDGAEYFIPVDGGYESDYSSDVQPSGGAYHEGSIHAARYPDETDEEEKHIDKFIDHIYKFKAAANAAFREHFTHIHSKNTQGVSEYNAFLSAIESLWDEKKKQLHTHLTANYNILPADAKDLLQTMLDTIHAHNTPKHSIASSHWIRRLFMECPGSTNTMSFKACEKSSGVPRK